MVLAGELTDDEFQFHATAIYASGGMVLSGDDLTAIPAGARRDAAKLLPPTGVAAEFDDATLTVGRMRLPDRRMICLFNWDDAPRDAECPAAGCVRRDRLLDRRTLAGARVPC